jgi:hypothetical protein
VAVTAVPHVAHVKSSASEDAFAKEVLKVLVTLKALLADVVTP